ncbi:MAG: ribosome assembly cofactor RimP [Paludibacteraceae bacterium]|nr:ribosome assembly cofactor RimP [Paludibacteraceae bacterium]
MILKQTIEQIVGEYLKDTECELVKVEVSGDNDIQVVVDSLRGVDLDFCAELSRHLESKLNRDKEDFSLEVSSMSLTDPFVTPLQFRKNFGNPVIVTLQDGRKQKGILTDVTDTDFELETEEKVQVEGKKRPQKQTVQYRYAFSEPKSVVYDLKI